MLIVAKAVRQTPIWLDLCRKLISLSYSYRLGACTDLRRALENHVNPLHAGRGAVHCHRP